MASSLEPSIVRDPVRVNWGLPALLVPRCASIISGNASAVNALVAHVLTDQRPAWGACYLG